jgi:hypothetical protein
VNVHGYIGVSTNMSIDDVISLISPYSKFEVYTELRKAIQDYHKFDTYNLTNIMLERGIMTDFLGGKAITQVIEYFTKEMIMDGFLTPLNLVISRNKHDFDELNEQELERFRNYRQIMNSIKFILAKTGEVNGEVIMKELGISSQTLEHCLRELAGEYWLSFPTESKGYEVIADEKELKRWRERPTHHEWDIPWSKVKF